MKTSMLCIWTCWMVLMNVSWGQENKKDTIKDWYNDPEMCNPLLVQNALKNQFATIYNVDLGNGLGSFASISIEEAKVDFSGNHRFKRGDVFGIKVNGGVSDNVTTIFSNTKWSSNFGVNLSYNFFWKNRLGKSFLPYRVEVLDSKLTSVRESANEVVYNSDIKKYESKINYQKDLKKLDSLKVLLQSNPNELLSAQIDLLKFKVASYDAAEIESEINLKRSDTLKILKASVQADKFRIHWLSISYGLNSNVFKRLDQTLSFSDQISKESFVTHKIRAQYQWYSTGYFGKGDDKLTILNAISNYFFAIYLEGGEKDNFASLSAVEIEEKTNFGSVPESRSSTEKYSVYTGDYKKGIQFLNFGADFYWFLFNNGKMGLHFSPKYRVAESLKPEFDFLTGFYTSFKNEKKDGPRVNVELFLNFTNLMKFNDPNIESNHLKRATYGLSFTMPINFSWE